MQIIRTKFQLNNHSDNINCQNEKVVFLCLVESPYYLTSIQQKKSSNHNSQLLLSKRCMKSRFLSEFIHHFPLVGEDG